MKIQMLLLGLFFLTNTAWTQNKHINYKHSIKVYNLSSYQAFSEEKYIPHMIYKSCDLSILKPTIAFQWQTKKFNFNEIEFTNFNVTKNTTTNSEVLDSNNTSIKVYDIDLISTSISLRFEHIINFNKTNDKKFIPSFGLGFSPAYRKENFVPRIASSFPNRNYNVDLNFYVLPRLTYYFTSNIFFDFNIPICIFNFDILSEKKEDPSLPVKQRTVTTFFLKGLPNIYSARIGIGVKI